MRSAAIVVLAASLFGLAPVLGRMQPVAASLVVVALAVAFACAASGEVAASAIGAGAIGALVGSAAGGIGTILGGAIVASAAYAVRTMRVRGSVTRGIHLSIAATAGAAAGLLVHSYIGAPLPLRLVAAAMASTLVLAPLLVPADDPIASLLETYASSFAPSLRYPLLDTAELRRHSREIPFDRATSKDLAATWKALIRLVEARARLDESRRIAPAHLTGRAPLRTVPPVQSDNDGAAPSDTAYRGAAASPADAVATMLERRVLDHIAILARAYSAVDAARAATLGLDSTTREAVDAADSREQAAE